MKAYTYSRWSPRPKDCDSIEAQEADLKAWCAANGCDVAGTFSDADVSGTVPIFNRPGLASAMRVLKRGDYFVVRNLNRSARSIEVALAIEAEIDRIGATLVSLEDGGVQQSKRDNISAWFARCVKYLISDYQRRETNERTSRRMRQHESNGRSMGRIPPYGWRKEEKRLVADENEQFILRQIKKLRGCGWSIGAIVDHLNKYRNEFPPRGKRWYPNTIRRALAFAERAPKVEAAAAGGDRE